MYLIDDSSLISTNSRRLFIINCYDIWVIVWLVSTLLLRHCVAYTVCILYRQLEFFCLNRSNCISLFTYFFFNMIAWTLTLTIVFAKQQYFTQKFESKQTIRSLFALAQCESTIRLVFLDIDICDFSYFRLWRR